MVTRFYDLQKRSQRLSNKLYSPCYSYSPGVWCINHTISALLFRSMAILLAIHEDDYSMSTLAIRKYFRCTLCFLPSVSFISFKGVNQDRNWIIIYFFDDKNELSFQCSPVHKYLIL